MYAGVFQFQKARQYSPRLRSRLISIGPCSLSHSSATRRVSASCLRSSTRGERSRPHRELAGSLASMRARPRRAHRIARRLQTHLARSQKKTAWRMPSGLWAIGLSGFGFHSRASCTLIPARLRGSQRRPWRCAPNPRSNDRVDWGRHSASNPLSPEYERGALRRLFLSSG